MNSDLFDEFKTQMYHSYACFTGYNCIMVEYGDTVTLCDAYYNELDNSLSFIRFTKHNRLVSVTWILDYFVFMFNTSKETIFFCVSEYRKHFVFNFVVVEASKDIYTFYGCFQYATVFWLDKLPI